MDAERDGRKEGRKEGRSKEDVLLKKTVHVAGIPRAVELLEVVSEVVQSEVNLVPVPAMIVNTIVSYRWSFGALVDRVFMALEIVGRSEARVHALAALLLALERLCVFCLVFSSESGTIKNKRA